MCGCTVRTWLAILCPSASSYCSSAPHSASRPSTPTAIYSWGKHGFTLERSGDGGLEIVFSISSWQTTEVEIEGQTWQTVQLPGALLPNDAGAPDLPGIGRYLAVPNGAEVTWRVVETRTVSIQDFELGPAPIIPRDTDTGPLQYIRDEEIYTRDAYYPESPVVLSPPTSVRGVSAVMLGITPYQYNPVTRELLVYRDLRVEVTFSSGEGRFGDNRLRSRWWDPILSSLLLNHESLDDVDYQVYSDSRTEDFEYLIICPDQPDFIAWADSLSHWRNTQGIRTGVVTTTDVGGNSISAIQGYLQYAYNNWTIPPSAVLLLADYGSGSNDIVSPVWDSYCVSDNIFGDMTGNDLPDIAMARITAQNATHLSTMVGKMLDYERAPPVDPNFYGNPIVAGGWQTSRWFILCTEVLQGFMANQLGKTPVREYAIYSGTPGADWSTATNTSTVVSYFGPGGLGYIPATPAHLTDWGGNATRINADVNDGAFILQHRDHGGTDG